VASNDEKRQPSTRHPTDKCIAAAARRLIASLGPKTANDLASVPARMKTFAERPLLLLLAAIQFTHITDFMMMMPLGPQLMRELGIQPVEFATLISSYTIASGVVTLLMAPFMDRFDRRTLLLWTYAGFVGGTLACWSPTFACPRSTCSWSIWWEGF